MKGLIIKNQNGYFTIYSNQGSLTRCRSRGRLKRSTNILVGDHVEFEPINKEEAVITQVYQRKNMLHRPPSANIDQLALVSAIRTPDLNTSVLDKMIVLAEDAGIIPMIVINKMDLDPDYASEVTSYYQTAGYQAFSVSGKDGNGMEELKHALSGPVVAFSGPSGAGKSTLLNHLLGYEYFSSGEVSRHTGRGRTTTRHAELVQSPYSYFLMDTPGFTALDIQSVDIQNLAWLYKDFQPYIGNCKFNNCVHDAEPGCAIRKALEEGHIQKKRYDSYIQILNELKSQSFRR